MNAPCSPNLTQHRQFSSIPDEGGAIQISVVVPTYNERENIPEMLRRLEEALEGLAWEAVIVDDGSPDGTADLVRAIAERDRRVRLILRHNRRGLSSAVVEGALASAAPIIAVMDGDLQHDESILPELRRRVASGEADIASASRFLAPDGADGLSSSSRRRMSETGIRMANLAFGLRLTDPLTGFFVFRRDVLRRALPRLSEGGFKILLDLIISADPPPRVMEARFRFRPRIHGRSKLDGRVLYDFVLFFIEKKVGRFVPAPRRFLSFALINSIGILLHLAILEAALRLSSASFPAAQVTATFAAMTFNYSANNAITYGDRRLKGPRFLYGFVLFALLCSLGIVANVGIATMIHERYADVGHVLPALAGALIAVVWNYAATRVLVWGRAALPSRRARRRGPAGRDPAPGGA